MIGIVDAKCGAMMQMSVMTRGAADLHFVGILDCWAENVERFVVWL